MADINPIFSYTNRDYETSRQESISKIPYMSNGDWTDLNATDPGIIILDHVHALADMIQYYMDHNALESYLSTSKERKNIFRIANQLGYGITSAKGAKVTVQFSTKKSYDSTYIIPKHTILTTSNVNNDKIPYLTTEDLIMYKGILKGEVVCVQGESGHKHYQGTGYSSIDGSINAEDQSIILDELGIDTDSIEIMDTKEYNWTRVENVAFSNPGAREYSVILLYDGKVKIQFGNDERGYTPKVTDSLQISYIHSLGSNGRVGANTLDTIIYPLRFTTDSGDIVTDLTVTNLEGSTSGSDPEDSELIRLLAPAIIKTQDRAVTLEDFESLARKVPGVRDAKAFDIKNSEDIQQYYEVKVLIIPEILDDTSSNEIVKKSVLEYLQSKCIPPLVISVITPVTRSIDITITVVIDNIYTENKVKYEILKNIEAYFKTLSGTTGGYITSSMISSLISKTPGVLYIEDLNFDNLVELGKYEIPVLGNVDITANRRSY